MLNNLRIGSRLLGLSIMLLCFLLLSGGAGYNGVFDIESRLTSIYNDRVIPLGQLSNILDSLHRIRTRVVGASGAADITKRDQQLKDITEYDATIDKETKDYLATTLTVEEEALAKEYVQNLANYRAVRGKVIDTIKNGTKEAATTLIETEGSQAFSKVITTTRKLLALQISVASAEYKLAVKTADEMRIQFLVLIGLALVLGIFLSRLISGSITRPIAALIVLMNRLSQGETNAEVVGTNRRDEVGDIARTLQVFKEKLVEMETMREKQKEAEIKAATERKKAMLEMADKFEANVMSVVEVVTSSSTEMHALLEDMSKRSESVRENMTSVSAATDETSANVHTVASAAEELSASISEIDRQVSDAAKISQKAADHTAATNATVQELANAAVKIGEVVNLINDIAAQTNLLALNATIEAARAGEAGKGFAVVAGEVKSLANQTAKATDEISSQITSIQDQTKHSVTAIQDIATIIDKVKEISSSIALAVNEQGAATREISSNVQQAAQGTQEVSINVSKVTAAALENVNNESQMVAASSELARNAEKLRQQVKEFLAMVRS